MTSSLARHSAADQQHSRPQPGPTAARHATAQATRQSAATAAQVTRQSAAAVAAASGTVWDFARDVVKVHRTEFVFLAGTLLFALVVGLIGMALLPSF